MTQLRVRKKNKTVEINNSFTLNSSTEFTKKELEDQLEQLKENEALIYMLGDSETAALCIIFRDENQNLEVKQNKKYLTGGSASKVSFDLMALSKGKLKLVVKSFSNKDNNLKN